MQWQFDYFGQSVPVMIWFPTVEPEITMTAGPFTLRFAPSAQPMDRAHPFIAISHGTGGSNVAHHTLAEALARRGYLVAALEHPGDNYNDRSMVATEHFFKVRPGQFRHFINALLSDNRLGLLIDPQRLGAIGHSIGGFTVAASIGASTDREALIEHCGSVVDDPSCNYRDPSLGVTTPPEAPYEIPAAALEVNDDQVLRFRSVALLAPMASVLSMEGEIKTDTAIAIVAAELDEILPHRYHAHRLQQIAPQAETSFEAGAGHFSFIAPINDGWKSQLAEVANDPEGFDRLAFSQKIALSISDWFHRTLIDVR